MKSILKNGSLLIFLLLLEAETVLEQIVCPQKPSTASVSVSVRKRAVATATTSCYLRREKINLRKGQKGSLTGG